MELEQLIKDWIDHYDNTLELELFNRIDHLPTQVKKILFVETLKDRNFLTIEIIDHLYGLTPIEQIFYLCLAIYRKNSNYLKEISLRLDFQKTLEIDGKKFIPDFLFTYFIANNKLIYLENPIIIECDGFEFHSTREQLNHDTIRENTLKMAGYSVIRFTGSQIYREPYHCVIQTLKFLYERNKKQIDTVLKGEKNAEKND